MAYVSLDSDQIKKAHKKHKYTKEQVEQIECIIKWLGERDAIICGDFNNVPGSKTITFMKNLGYIDLLESDKYIPNIRRDMSTEFHRKNNIDKPEGSRIDYVFSSKKILENHISSHIIDFERMTPFGNQNKKFRSETSDHLPILSVFKYFS